MNERKVKITVTDLDGILLDSIIVMVPQDCSAIAIHLLNPGEHSATDEELEIGQG